MGISLARLDNRLLHGIVASQWTPKSGANRVMVIDDKTANTPMIKEAMRMGKPSGCSLSIINKETAPVFESKYTMTIPSRTQDVEFINKKNVIISRSNQTSSSASKYYISRMEKYKLNWKKSSRGKVALKKCTGKITMPPMMEGIAYRKGYIVSPDFRKSLQTHKSILL